MVSQASVVVLINSTGEVGGAWGSSGPATRKLHGVTSASLTVTEEAEAVPAVGYYGPGPIMEEVKRGAEFSLDGVWTYQEAPKLLNNLFNPTSGSTVAADPYAYHYYAPVHSTQAHYTYTLEYGTSGNAYIAPGAVFNTFRLSGEAGSYWKYSIGGLAEGVAALSAGLTTAALGDVRAQTAVPMARTNIRFHPFTTGAWGSSSGQISAALVSFEFNLDTKRHLKYFAGSPDAGGYGDGRYEGSLRTVLEFNSSQKALLDELLGASTGVALQRQITLWASSTSTAGTTGFLSALNFAGMVNAPIKLWEDRDGNCILDLSWGAKFTTALQDIGTSGTGNWLTFRIDNGSSSTT